MLRIRRHYYSYNRLHPRVRYHQKQANYYQGLATTQYDAAMCRSDSAPPSKELLECLTFHVRLADWYMRKSIRHRNAVLLYRAHGKDWAPTEWDYATGFVKC